MYDGTSVCTCTTGVQVSINLLKFFSVSDVLSVVGPFSSPADLKKEEANMKNIKTPKSKSKIHS